MLFKPAGYCRIVLLRKKPPFRKKTAQGFKLLVFYFRIVKATTPTKVRTALNSSEKSTVRLKFNSQLRHNCSNTRRKQASDGVKSFIASLLCRATAPNSRLEPFFLYTPFSRRRLKGASKNNLGSKCSIPFYFRTRTPVISPTHLASSAFIAARHPVRQLIGGGVRRSRTSGRCI